MTRFMYAIIRLLAILILAGPASAGLRAPSMPISAPAISAADTAGIAEARTIVKTVGDALWSGWSKTPFTIDLITPQYEFLLHASTVPKGFLRMPNGDAYRPRIFPTNLEAMFPAFDRKPIIVIGEQPLTAVKTPTRWVVTLLHEHFHQWQSTWPAYYAAVDALNLANGDKTGMWMLNYAFPYHAPKVDARFKKLAAHLYSAVRATGTKQFDAKLQAYLNARATWRASLNPSDYRYFAFQCWQEGVARYTEYRIARLAAHEHALHPVFLTARQAHHLDVDSQRTYAEILDQLKTGSLAKSGRAAFYAFGAGEALLLDRAVPHWRSHYLDPRMDLGHIFSDEALPLIISSTKYSWAVTGALGSRCGRVHCVRVARGRTARR